MGILIMPLVWLIAFAAFLAVELCTMGLTTIWFAGGSLVACILSLFKAPIWIQIVVFVAVSIVLLYFTRPVAVKYFNKTRLRTNVEGIIGKQAVVVTDIDNIQGTGVVKISGMEWTARSYNDEPIESGKVVIVKKVEGVKLIVKEEKE